MCGFAAEAAAALVAVSFFDEEVGVVVVEVEKKERIGADRAFLLLLHLLLLLRLTSLPPLSFPRSNTDAILTHRATPEKPSP